MAWGTLRYQCTWMKECHIKSLYAVLKFSNCKNFRYLKKKWIIAFQNSNPSKNCKNPCCFQAHDLQIFNWLDKETLKENDILKNKYIHNIEVSQYNMYMYMYYISLKEIFCVQIPMTKHLNKAWIPAWNTQICMTLSSNETLHSHLRCGICNFCHFRYSSQRAVCIACMCSDN